MSVDQRGDTIVEVLIAIAVVSTVLVAAYTTASRNIVAIQNNQERVQAQHLVEGQIEALKSHGPLATGFTCFDQSGAPANGSHCTFGNVAGSGASYTTSVTLNPANVYVVKTMWTTLGASTDNDASVTMYYELQ